MLQLLARGMSNIAIGRKLNVSRRAEAVYAASKLGLI